MDANFGYWIRVHSRPFAFIRGSRSELGQHIESGRVRKVLIDANVLLRVAQPAIASHATALAALTQLANVD